MEFKNSSQIDEEEKYGSREAYKFINYFLQ